MSIDYALSPKTRYRVLRAILYHAKKEISSVFLKKLLYIKSLLELYRLKKLLIVVKTDTPPPKIRTPPRKILGISGSIMLEICEKM